MLTRLFRRRDSAPSQSIYDHVRAHVPAGRPGLDDAGLALPDDADFDGPVRFAPGAMDGIPILHGSAEANSTLLESVLGLVLGALRRADRPDIVRQLDVRLKKVDFLSVVDPLAGRLHAANPDWRMVARLGRRLATESTTRNGVKLGIALLGMVSGEDTEDVLLTLGRHEEFTLYSAVALESTSSDPEGALWDLARVVEGWGRIETVRRLRHTRRDDIRAWLLREGFRNNIMDEYLAYIAATTGGLLAELEKDDIDDEMLTAACDIIAALTSGGPAESIEDYDEAPRAVELLLRHLRRRRPELRRFHAIDAIERFLADRDVTSPDVFRPELRERLRQTAQDIKRRPEWRQLVERSLQSSDEAEFYRAAVAARSLGMKVLDAYLQQLRMNPAAPAWYFAMHAAADEGRIDEVVALAEQKLRLDDIASGPALELGLGPEFAEHSRLDYVVQELRRFPGKGLSLLLAALRSPVVRNRNMALVALDAWVSSEWPTGARQALQDAHAVEPDPELKAGMQALLQGEKLVVPTIRFGAD